MDHLNKQQKEAVMHKDGPILVIAGAGTGKTRVITERIAHILNQGWCRNSEVLALTFMEKAAGEMEERLDTLMPLGYETVQISTFHSFCEKIIREYGIDIGISSNFKILQGVQQWQFMKDHLFEFDLNYYRPLGNPTSFIDSLLNHFSRVKEELRSPDDYLKFALDKEKSAEGDDQVMDAKKYLELANAYKFYEELMAKNDYLDFSDLQTKVIELFIKRPNILSHVQDKYKYVLVDEYQDTNIAQNYMIDMIVKKHKNIMVVGDDDQSIYKFRGAAISNILQFEDKYSDLKQVVLTENYRSNQAVLDFSYTSIVKNNPDRLEIKSGIDKKLHAQSLGSKDSIKLVHCYSIEQEIEYIVDCIKKSKTNLSNIALLCRANNHAKPFIDAFKHHNIPYQFLSEKGLYDKEEIRDLISILRVVSNPTDDISFYRVLRMDVWNIPMETIANLISKSKESHSSIWSQIKNSTECEKLVSVISDVLEYSKDHTAGEVLYYFSQKIDLYELILKNNDIESEEKVTNISTFFNKIKDFERENENITVIDFISYLDLAQEAGENPSAKFDLDTIDGVQITTIHGAKGLEYDTVFLTSLIKGRFPSNKKSNSIEVPSDLIGEILTEGDFHTEEERRLFYVAITRAKENLHLIHSDYYSFNSAKPRLSKRSLFIDEIIDDINIKQIEKPLEGSKDLSDEMKTSPLQENQKKGKHSKVTQFSYSKLSTFNTCPKRYQYSYIYKVPQPPSATLNFGSTIHNTLYEFCRLYLQSKQDTLFEEFKPDLSLSNLLKIYEDKWISYGYDSKEDMNTRKQRGKEILNRFHSHFESNPPNVQYLEKGFNLKIGSYTIKGSIDRADMLNDGTLEIIDYKTGKTKKQSDIDKNEQLMIYTMAIRQCFNIDSSKNTLYFLDGDEKISTVPNEKKIEKLENKIIETCDKINEFKFKAKPSEHTCGYCPFKKICDSAITKNRK